MRAYFPMMLLIAAAWPLDRHASAQDATIETLSQQVEVLELKLKLAEAQLENLKRECDLLRKENATLKNAKTDEPVPAEDPFKPGKVWAGETKAVGKETIKWAISISKRDGRGFEGGVAIIKPDGTKAEFPVTGQAPQSGDGLVIIESPIIGRAQLLMRGTLRNGAIALAFSGTNPLGEKLFGSASLYPKN